MSAPGLGNASLHDLFDGWFDYYAARARDRFVGLTDDEYLSEPVPGCWSIRTAPDGTARVADWAWPPPEPAPVTTIAWRFVHVCSMLSEHGLRPVAFERGAANHIAPSQVPATAVDALATFDRSVDAWKRDIATVSEARLWEPLGPEAGPFAADVVASFIEHIHDELIHHTAEIGLLRDLYRFRTQM